MSTEDDESVKDIWKLSYGNYVVKMVEDDNLEDKVKILNSKPLHLGAFVLSNSKSNMNNFIHVLDGFKINELYYGDTDSLYIEKEHWDISDRAGLNGKNLKRAKK